MGVLRQSTSARRGSRLSARALVSDDVQVLTAFPTRSYFVHKMGLMKRGKTTATTKTPTGAGLFRKLVLRFIIKNN